MKTIQLQQMLTALLLVLASCTAFTPSHLRSCGKCTSLCMRMIDPNSQASNSQSLSSRRHVLKNLVKTTISLSSILTSLSPTPTNAVVMSVESKSTTSPISRDEAVNRFKAGRESVRYLLDHYDEICEGGGDNVRRYLGTVGVSSGLFGIGKALKVLGEEVDDIVEYTELATEVEKTIQQADGSAYMAIFVTTSSSSTPPARYFKDAKVEIERCAQTLDDLAVMIGL